MSAADEIAAQYNLLGDALSHRDRAAVSAIVPDEKLAKSMLARVSEFVRVTVHIEVTNLSQDGAAVQVQAQYSLDGTHKTAGGSPEPYHTDAAVIDVWTLRDGRWQLTVEQESQETQIVN